MESVYTDWHLYTSHYYFILTQNRGSFKYIVYQTISKKSTTHVPKNPKFDSFKCSRETSEEKKPSVYKA